METRVLRLLVVDDLEDWRYSIGLQFDEREDIEIVEAVGGDDAVEKIKERDFDLVLLDLRMPSGTEGLDALAQIKKLKPQTQVIMMSAYGDIAIAVEAIKRGALDFITKEDDFDDVVKYKTNEFIRAASLIADRERLIRFKYEETLKLKNSQKKGKALEELLAAILASIDGFIEVGRNLNTKTEEIDLFFRNESREPAWRKESEMIAVECKNWKSQRVGKNEFVLFATKIENRYSRCQLGFLVCVEEFAETVTSEMLRYSKSDILVVPINGEALRRLVEEENRSRLLRGFVDQALLV